VNNSEVADFVLEQNYPNPFNPITNIEFFLPEAGIVILEVFNLLGEKVAEPLAGWVNAGYHRAILNAADLAAGTYLYRITMRTYGESDAIVLTRKMILLK
jgi:hypothetical protein